MYANIPSDPGGVESPGPPDLYGHPQMERGLPKTVLHFPQLGPDVEALKVLRGGLPAHDRWLAFDVVRPAALSGGPYVVPGPVELAAALTAAGVVGVEAGLAFQGPPLISVRLSTPPLRALWPLTASASMGQYVGGLLISVQSIAGFRHPQGERPEPPGRGVSLLSREGRRGPKGAPLRRTPATLLTREPMNDHSVYRNSSLVPRQGEAHDQS